MVFLGSPCGFLVNFVSDLIWIEAKGNYQISQMNFGRYLDDTIKTQKEVVNIETMTLRVWYAEISTTTFGKYQERSILSMIAKKDEAIAIKEHLSTFAQDQSIIVAPTAQSDLNRMSALNHLNNAVGATQATQVNQGVMTAGADHPAIQDQFNNTDSQEPIIVRTEAYVFCTSCGHKLEKSMLFCPQCGTAKVK